MAIAQAMGQSTLGVVKRVGRRSRQTEHIARMQTDQRQRAQSAPVVARWVLRAKFGRKLRVCSLLHEWLDDIASHAGAEPSKARVLAGAIGEDETRIELELGLWSMSELEHIIASLDRSSHSAWSQRLEHEIEGSPCWVVMNSVSPSHADNAPTPPAASSSAGTPSAIVDSPSFAATSSGKVEQDDRPPASEGRWVKDWKGEWLEVNPGDSLPGL